MRGGGGVDESSLLTTLCIISLTTFCPPLPNLSCHQNGDYPFKMGTYMGCDAAGNRYYENRVDYPFGQHRWVEPGDIHNLSPSALTLPLQNQRHNVPETKMSTLTPLMDMLWSIIPNLQEIIFGPIRVGLITQNQFWDH